MDESAREQPRTSVTITSVEKDDATDLSIAVGRQASAEVPALVTIRVTNAWMTEREFPFGSALLFPPLVGATEAGTERLHLVPHGGTIDGEHEQPTGYSASIPESPSEGCWRVVGDHTENDERTAMVWVSQPGSYLQRDYVVLDDEAADDCFPDGDYRFSASWREETPEGEVTESTVEFVIAIE